MNLTLALLAVTAAIPVSLQPHSVKFYSFLVVAARPQPCRGGWWGESPALRKLEAGEAKQGTAARWDMPGGWGAARSLHGLLRAGMSCAQGGMVLHVGTRSITAIVPSRGGGGGDLGQLCLRAVGLWWGDAIRHPAWGTWLGSGQSRRRRIPAGCEWGPTVRLGTPPRLLPNENQLYICFISAQRCSGPRGDEECGQQAVPWHCPSPCSFPSATCVSPSR